MQTQFKIFCDAKEICKTNNKNTFIKMNLIQKQIVGQVKDLLKKVIDRHAKDIGLNPEKVFLLIYSKDNTGMPSFILKDTEGKVTKNCEFRQLLTMPDIIKYKMLGFDVVGKCPGYVQNFILRACEDYNLPVENQQFFIRKHETEYVAAYMVHKSFKEDKKIDLGYIVNEKKEVATI